MCSECWFKIIQKCHVFTDSSMYSTLPVQYVTTINTTGWRPAVKFCIYSIRDAETAYIKNILKNAN